jgi:hypothetical protein
MGTIFLASFFGHSIIGLWMLKATVEAFRIATIHTCVVIMIKFLPHAKRLRRVVAATDLALTRLLSLAFVVIAVPFFLTVRQNNLFRHGDRFAIRLLAVLVAAPTCCTCWEFLGSSIVIYVFNML